ncbi:MAG: PaaI family thioesterase [Pseudomonadota bacterium]
MECDRESRNAADSDSNRCFVCGPGNTSGLGVHFDFEGETCVGNFTPGEAHAGYGSLTHGGIVFSLLDDVMANWLWLQGTKCFTARADVRYRAHLPLGTPVRLEGECRRRKGRLALMEGRVIRRDTEEVVAEASGAFMISNQ